MKRLFVATTVVPLALVLGFVRPVDAAGDPVYDQAGLTAIAAAGRTDGVVGASGGLVTLDTGSAYVSAQLDSSPSAAVVAAPQEPGTLFHTGAGQVNGAAGQTVVGTLEAEARYPGDTSASFNVGDPVDSPPVYLGAANADAKVSPTHAEGLAQAARYSISPLFDVGPGTSAVHQDIDLGKGTAKQDAKVTVSDVDLAGVLKIQGVVGTASVTADHDTHTAKQDLVISGATVAGQQVAITNDGVVAAGTPLVPGTTLSQATDTVNGVLAGAGITQVHTLGGTQKHTGRSAEASTGGVEIVMKTPDLPGGVSANSLTITLGGISLTELDALAIPSAPVVEPSSDPGTTAQPPTSVTTVIPGTPAIPGTLPGPVQQPPQVLQPNQSVAFEVNGRRISDKTALLAFAGWQMLSLGTATLYGFVERRRRLVQLGRTP
ncbi:MAG: hypothetical protein JWO22_977 [Frankiales bacterium]|nr:hypothetical protein [Frankiales bacterium]